MQRVADLEAALAETPGIHVTDVEREGGIVKVRGLKDPLAADVGEIARNLGIPADGLELYLQPFQSLAPEIVVARSERELGRPASVQFRLQGSTLIATGEAPSAWRRQLETNFDKVTGIDSLDTAGLMTSGHAALLQAVEELDARYFYFDEGVVLSAGSDDALRNYGAELEAVAATAREFGYALRATVLGSTDGTGAAAVNANLATARANVIADTLRDKGVQVRETGELQPAGHVPAGAVAMKQRNAQVRLELVPPSP